MANLARMCASGLACSVALGAAVHDKWRPLEKGFGVASTGCSLQLSREAAEIIEIDVVERAAEANVPFGGPWCPLNIDGGLFFELERAKWRQNSHAWQCRVGGCGKAFRSERYLDHHLLIRHTDVLLPSARAGADGIRTCLADFCGLLGCPGLSHSHLVDDADAGNAWLEHAAATSHAHGGEEEEGDDIVDALDPGGGRAEHVLAGSGQASDGSGNGTTAVPMPLSSGVDEGRHVIRGAARRQPGDRHPAHVHAHASTTTTARRPDGTGGSSDRNAAAGLATTGTGGHHDHRAHSHSAPLQESLSAVQRRFKVACRSIMMACLPDDAGPTPQLTQSAGDAAASQQQQQQQRVQLGSPPPSDAAHVDMAGEGEGAAAGSTGAGHSLRSSHHGQEAAGVGAGGDVADDEDCGSDGEAGEATSHRPMDPSELAAAIRGVRAGLIADFCDDPIVLPVVLPVRSPAGGNDSRTSSWSALATPATPTDSSAAPRAGISNAKIGSAGKEGGSGSSGGGGGANSAPATSGAPQFIVRAKPRGRKAQEAAAEASGTQFTAWTVVWWLCGIAAGAYALLLVGVGGFYAYDACCSRRPRRVYVDENSDSDEGDAAHQDGGGRGAATGDGQDHAGGGGGGGFGGAGDGAAAAGRMPGDGRKRRQRVQEMQDRLRRLDAGGAADEAEEDTGEH